MSYWGMLILGVYHSVEVLVLASRLSYIIGPESLKLEGIVYRIVGDGTIRAIVEKMRNLERVREAEV